MMRRSSSPPESHSPLRQRRIMIANMVERVRQAPSGWVSDSSSSSDDDDDVSLDGGSDDVYESYEKLGHGARPCMSPTCPSRGETPLLQDVGIMETVSSALIGEMGSCGSAERPWDAATFVPTTRG